MRIDEAACICASRVALMKQSQGESTGRTKSNGGGWENIGGGRQQRSIGSMKELYSTFGYNGRLPEGIE